MINMCSLRDFPELCDQSFSDKNVSMSVVKRVKPEVGKSIIFYYFNSIHFRSFTTNNRWR